MYYFNMIVCIGGVLGGLSLLKVLDWSPGLTAALGVLTMLLGVVGIAWLSAKDSAAEAARKQLK
jgi:hypothetical protein